jgi:hypothetical protein
MHAMLCTSTGMYGHCTYVVSSILCMNTVRTVTFRNILKPPSPPKILVPPDSQADPHALPLLPPTPLPPPPPPARMKKLAADVPYFAHISNGTADRSYHIAYSSNHAPPLRSVLTTPLQLRRLPLQLHLPRTSIPLQTTQIPLPTAPIMAP